jgi:hypothetical protein
MRGAGYNSAIPDVILNTVHRALHSAPTVRTVVQLSIFILWLAIAGHAVDWSEPEQQLARKIVAVTGPGAVALMVENRSSFGRRDNEIIQNGLRSALEGLGLRFVNAEQAAATVTISLSESLTSYVWVAEIRQGSGAVAVMVSAPRPEGSIAAHDSVPLSLRKAPLWSQRDAILDVAVLEESDTPTHIAVLDGERVTLYRLQGGKTQQEQALEIVHARPWPRDLRGRLVADRDHLLDVYLPGVICRSTAAVPLSLNCRESDDPWPLVPTGLRDGSSPVFPTAGVSSVSKTIPPVGAFFASTRNFFTGVLTPVIGKVTTVPKFYSAAWLPRERYTLWLFAATDGQVHEVDGVSDQTARLGWGSDLTSVRTSCGAGWQVLATSSGEGKEDAVRAYEFPDRDPIAVSNSIDFAGAVTALWTEAKGDTAIVVVRNSRTGNYEAYRLALACSQ